MDTEAMKTLFVNYFSTLRPLSEGESKAITDSMQIETYKKGEILLKEGEIAKVSYFVLQGCVRQYYVVDGEEKTSDFFTEEQWVMSLNSLMTQTPANHYFCCMEDTALVIGNEEMAMKLYEHHPQLETISRTIMEKEFAKQQEMLASYVTDSPEQRYLKLLDNNPELVQRVPQYQLASYIGVKPESLSRIRKRLFMKR